MTSLRRSLISHGFSDLDRSAHLLEAEELAGLDRDSLLARLGNSANPDLALLSLVRLWQRAPRVRELLSNPVEQDSQLLLTVLGASEGLTEIVLRDPEAISILVPGADLTQRSPEQLRAALEEALSGEEGSAEEGSGESTPLEKRALPPKSTAATVSALAPAEATRALRRAYRRELLRIAARDLSSAQPQVEFTGVSEELADLAAAAIEVALQIARVEARSRFSEQEIAQLRIAVMGMGKTGARELNYISDVDVIYVIDGGDLDPQRAQNLGTYLARGLSKVLSSSGPEPPLWELDPNLRPEGKDGPLVRTVDSHRAYYERWSQNWEFQALLKARLLAGDPELAAQYLGALTPMVWMSSQREGFVSSVQAMRARVNENIAPANRGREIKLGPGGLRDVEFTVQLLQLVHGRVDETVRHRSTVDALRALSAGGYVGRKDAAELEEAYRYLRVLENRIQLLHLRRTHLMPVHEDELRALARSLGSTESGKRASAQDLLDQWNAVRRRVRALHERIFYRPLLATAAHLSEDEVKLSPEAAKERLGALGFIDPAGALRHIEALTKGISRRAAIQRTLLPAMLEYFAEGVDPDHGLLAFRRLSETLGNTPWYLSMLRDAPGAAENLCKVLSSGRMIPDLLEANAEAAAWLGNPEELVPVGLDSLWREITSKMSRHTTPEGAIRHIRLIRQREILRTAIADALGMLSQAEVGVALATADRAAILGALHVAERSEYGDSPENHVTDVLVVALGRQGGQEVGYGSDADVIFVHRPRQGADKSAANAQAERIVSQLSTLLTRTIKPAILAERPLSLDISLRPEGKSGAKVRSLDAYRDYYRQWSGIWEAQALLRARPIAGSDEVAEAFIEVIDPVRYPLELPESERREILRIKARVEAERLPRGADASRHLKLGRGSLSDIEWLIQLLQLKHAHTIPALRTTSTMGALRVLVEHALIEDDDAQILAQAWELASRIRSGGVVWSGKVVDTLSEKREDLEALSRWCGNPAGQASAFEEHYLKTTRRARAVFEKYFYE